MSSAAGYVPLFELAKGGLGRVEVVMRHDGSYERLYVKKRPHGKDAETRATFLDEARLAGLLRHPNVVGVLDVGEDDEGPYLVMDFVEGVHVGELIQHLAGEPIPLGVALEITRQAAEGLHAVHELQSLDGRPLGVVHRDVSPQNLLLGFDGVVRLTDLGIALADQRRAQDTTIGVLKGKVGYTAPEQLSGEPLDRRADLFALGVVLVELLTGQRLYRGDTNAEVGRQILEDDPPDVGALRRDAPPELVELVFDLLAKSREARPLNAREVATRLRAMVEELGEEERIDELLLDLFAERRTILRDRVREARERRLRAVLERRERAHRRKLGWRVGLAAAALVTVALGVWWTRTNVDPPLPVPLASTPVTSTPVTSTPLAASPMTETSTAGLPPARDDEPTAVATQVEPPSEDDAEASVATERGGSTSRTRRRRRRPPRVAPEAPTMATGSNLPPTSWWPRE
ncbi:MAG: serine/threonine protein kinase [Sandaracinus sp.]|nr:serine/threonine protein kinase [Sandaracinus sp.]MCB9631583.1 serine/threonine protein kinase [Sandaracinus sp.]